MRPKTVLLIYGEGGHRAQMQRLYGHIGPNLQKKNITIIGICENNDQLDEFINYSQMNIRDKHHSLKNFLTTPFSVFQSILLVSRLVAKYRIVGVISTGPGIAIVPSVVLKILGTKVVFLESWSRFTTKSITGQLMYYLADRFYVQHKCTKDMYPNSRHSGLL